MLNVKTKTILTVAGTVLALTALVTAGAAPASAHHGSGGHHSGSSSSVYCTVCDSTHTPGDCPNYCGDCGYSHTGGCASSIGSAHHGRHHG